MKRTVRLIAALALLLPSACATTDLSQAFEPGPALGGTRMEHLYIVVGEDERPEGGRTSLGPGFLSWIPLVPYGHQRFSPEFNAFTSGSGGGDFRREVADTVIKDLRAAGVARQVGYEDDLIPGMPVPENAYRLHLTLTEGLYNRYVTLYGLSLAGTLLWFVGLPSSYGNADLGIIAELRDPQGESLGRQEFRGKQRATEWLYYPMTAAYPPAMPKAYGEISPELRAFIVRSLSGD